MAASARERISAVLRDHAIRLIGIDFSYTMQFNEVRALAALRRELPPESVIAVGGPHPTFLPERTIEELPDVDVVVRGEGDWTLEEVLSRIERGVPLEGTPGTTAQRRRGGLEPGSSAGRHRRAAGARLQPAQPGDPARSAREPAAEPRLCPTTAPFSAEDIHKCWLEMRAVLNSYPVMKLIAAGGGDRVCNAFGGRLASATRNAA